jgi:hypothetical protein
VWPYMFQPSQIRGFCAQIGKLLEMYKSIARSITGVTKAGPPAVRYVSHVSSTCLGSFFAGSSGSPVKPHQSQSPHMLQIVSVHPREPQANRKTLMTVPLWLKARKRGSCASGTAAARRTTLTAYFVPLTLCVLSIMFLVVTALQRNASEPTTTRSTESEKRDLNWSAPIQTVAKSSCSKCS